jgi:hypothetical protein
MNMQRGELGKAVFCCSKLMLEIAHSNYPSIEERINESKNNRFVKLEEMTAEMEKELAEKLLKEATICPHYYKPKEFNENLERTKYKFSGQLLVAPDDIIFEEPQSHHPFFYIGYEPHFGEPHYVSALYENENKGKMTDIVNINGISSLFWGGDRKINVSKSELYIGKLTVPRKMLELFLARPTQ